MKTNRIIALVSLIFLLISITVISCKKNDDGSNGKDCTALADEVDAARVNFVHTASKENCQAVVAAYNAYISNNCPDASSYENERDAFEAANNCQ